MLDQDMTKAFNEFERELRAYWWLTNKAPAPKSLQDMCNELKSKLIHRSKITPLK